MIEVQRRAYLDAMDISVWVRKPVAVAQDKLCIGPGSDNTLLVCRDASETAMPVAADICRYLDSTPVWAWPDPEGNPQLPSLKEAIDQYLYTRVFLFGQAMASRVCIGRIPDAMGSARVIVVPALDELGSDAAARKQLWRHFYSLRGSGR